VKDTVEMDDKGALEQIHQYHQHAMQLVRDGELEEAIAEMERAADAARSAGTLGAEILTKILTNLETLKTKAADPDFRSNVLSHKAAALLEAGDFDGARRAFADVVEGLRRASPVDPVDLARALSNLSVTCTDLAQDDEAQAHSREAFEILEAAGKQTDPIMTVVMHNWGYSHKTAARWTAAHHCFSTARRLLENSPSATPLDIATMLQEEADLLGKMLWPGNGFPLAYECMEARQKALGTANEAVGKAAQLAGALLTQMGNHSKAVSYLRPAYQIFSTTLGAYDGDTIAALHDLFTASWKAGEEVTSIEEDLRHLIPISQSLGPNLLVCRELTDLAGLLAARGADEESKTLALEAEQAFAVLDHQNDERVVRYCEDLASVLTRHGEGRRALGVRERACRAGDQLIAQAVATRDMVFRRRYLSRLASDTATFVRHVVDYGAEEPRAVSTAFEFVINRKGLRAESAMAHNDARLAERQPELAPILEKTRALEQQIQEVHAGGAPDGNRKKLVQLDELRGELRKLNGEIETRTRKENRPVARTDQPANAAAIAAALPPGSALIEYFALLAPLTADEAEARQALEGTGDDEWLMPERKAERYVAFVVLSGDSRVRIVDIGEAPGLERLIYSYVASMGGGNRQLVPREWQPNLIDSDEATLSGDLRSRLVDPLLTAVDTCATLFVAPDGAICRVPFGALPDAGSSTDRLLDRLTIGYVTCGRDLLEFRTSTPAAEEPPLVVGDPDYDFAKPGVALPPPAAVDGFTDFYFERLEGTADEAWRVSQLIGGRRLTGQRAHETAVRECRSPAILHIAAHGYYVRPFSQGVSVIGNWREGDFGVYVRGEVLGFAGDPFVRSGIALAGVNAWSMNRPLPAEVGDGLLTSSEVAHMNLAGTELVVLSACSGALGDVRPGDGVAGLLHAFRVAGTRAIVAALWQIPDEATAKLMRVFYDSLLAGHSRLEAACEAQRALRTTAQPWEWASYVCYGDPGPIRYRPPRDTARSS
jgi:CHAT domain-containing protein/tetratricopeptide (TPR) repeat protein